MINLERIRNGRLETNPYRWAGITDLFEPGDADRLASTYPCDHYKLLSARGGEKDYEYHARSFIPMNGDDVTYRDELDDSWQVLAADLLSAGYRNAMTTLTGCDLTQAPMEVNVFHYGPGCSLGAHPDLPDKVVTHVLYFNSAWNIEAGGCLNILRSANASDIAALVVPVVGSSAVLVRSDDSWHSVSPVVSCSPISRRSMTVTFYRPGSASSMWPPGDTTPLYRYETPQLSELTPESVEVE